MVQSNQQGEKFAEVSKNKKLEKELTQLSNLRDVLGRSKQVASSVGTILDSFDHRLARLEMTILPVYQQTGNLQRRQQNTEKTLQSLDYVIGFYNVASEVEGIIRERPNSVGIPEYLKAMDQLYNAAQFFEKNNPQAIELENVKTLFNSGCQQLSIEFRDELKKYQKPLPPVLALELIDLEDSELSEENLSSFELIPVSVREDLKNVASWLDAHASSDRLTVYAKQRGFSLSESLKTLRAYQKSNSAERGASLGLSSLSSSSSPAFTRSRLGKIEFSRTRSKISQRATRALMRAMPVQSVSARRPGAPGANEENLDENDISIYLNQVTALHHFSYLELLLCHQLVPQEKVTRTFELIIKDPINDLATEGENLAFQAHRSVSRGDLQAVLSLLVLLKHMTVMQGQYEALLSSCQLSYRAKFSSIVTTLQDTTSKALEGFIVSLKNEGEKALPKDGTVHELTSNTLIFVEQLIDYVETLAPILQKDILNPNEKMKSELKAKYYLGCYIRSVLSHLGRALVHRSSSYSDPTLCSIFCLNNYNYVLKSLQNSDLLSIVSLAEPECANAYNANILEQKRIYSESLRKLVAYMDPSDDLPPSVLRAEKLRDKDRQFIKEKFSGLNKEIEELQRVQRGYSIPDLELRESIKRDNKEQILPKYQAFYDKYTQVNFSKAPEKYIKYTPADVSHKLDEFFDVAA